MLKKMNASNFAHAGLALACQILTALTAIAFGADLFEACVMGGLLAVGFYLGREVDQAEKKAGTPPWWSGFVVTNWSQDAILDLVFPVCTCSAVCLIAFLWG